MLNKLFITDMSLIRVHIIFNFFETNFGILNINFILNITKSSSFTKKGDHFFIIILKKFLLSVIKESQ